MRYWSFISHSHTDKKFARRLHRDLESISIPKHSKRRNTEQLSDKLRPIFIDNDELPASANLPEHIDNALKESHSLVVTCSRQARLSKWVNAEVTSFLELGRAERIFLVVVDGDPTSDEDDQSPFPPALGSGAQQAFWIDARPSGEGQQRVVARVASGILGLNFDDLWRREERRRKSKLAAGLMLAVFLLTSISLSYYFSQARIDLEKCPLDELTFRDPWLGKEMRILRSAGSYYYLCGGEVQDGPNVKAFVERANCRGPYGSTVLHALVDENDLYFVYSIISGSPCCGWGLHKSQPLQMNTGTPRVRALCWVRFLLPLLSPIPLGALMISRGTLTIPLSHTLVSLQRGT